MNAPALLTSGEHSAYTVTSAPLRRLTLAEYTRRAFPPLPRPTADALTATGAVTVTADLDGRTILTSTSYVGTVRVGSIELRITPKITIRRLLWLIGHAQDPAGWRDEDLVDLAAVEDLTTAIAVSFLAAADRAFARGILQGYRTVEEAIPLLRGRLREADQLRRRLGLPIPAEVRYDDYTVDTAENRLLLAATLRLLRAPSLPVRTRAGLRRIRMLLADVTAPIPGVPVPAHGSDRLTRHYQPALRLARLILNGRSLEQPPGPVTASGFLFNLNTVFEDWLTAAMLRAVRPFGGRVLAQHSTHLDTAHRISIQPDLVWQVGARPVAVLDAKYKRIATDNRHHADLYQMLAYCTALGVPAGHLVYAAGTLPPQPHRVRNTETALHTWALDLSAPVADLLAQVDDIVREMVKGTEVQARGHIQRRPG